MNLDNILKLRIMLSKVRLKVLKFEKIYIFEINNHNQNVFCLFSKVCYRKIPHISLSHTVGTSINFAFCEEIINSDIPFIMVVYEKIFGSINK